MIKETVVKDCKHKDCKYRSTLEKLQMCNYILLEGKPRECKISDCDKYEPRRKKRSGKCNKN